jgi:DNA replication and repair protein RecF
MGLSSLSISQFRNLHSVTIQPDKDLNIIIGNNAAGKTSLLEAIFYLSYGRSFRSSQFKHLIHHEESFFRLICELDDSAAQIGLERDAKNQTIRVNRQSITRLSELSTLLPVLVLHPDSHQLISSGPEYRRQYMDWGVFHVEHQFLESWKKYRKALGQRNASLKQMQADRLCSLWDKQLNTHAQVIEKYRLNYLSQISRLVTSLSEKLFPGYLIELRYKRGWSDDIEYSDYLKNNLSKDREKGFTQSGPHRADITITVDGKSAQHSISRGQQKKLVCLLKIAQLTLFSELSTNRCILLFDDLPAELDDKNQNTIMSILSKLNVQLFITAIEAKQINCEKWESYKVFHVEHGEFSERDTE